MGGLRHRNWKLEDSSESQAETTIPLAEGLPGIVGTCEAELERDVHRLALELEITKKLASLLSTSNGIIATAWRKTYFDTGEEP